MLRLENLKVGQVVGYADPNIRRVELVKIERVTPSGQVVVKYPGEEKRFYPPYYNNLMSYERAADVIFERARENVRLKLRSELRNQYEAVEREARANRVTSSNLLEIISVLKEMRSYL